MHYVDEGAETLVRAIGDRVTHEPLPARAEQGLPRVNALTDVHNAVSVRHQIPLGGEDFRRYEGPVPSPESDALRGAADALSSLRIEVHVSRRLVGAP